MAETDRNAGGAGKATDAAKMPAGHQGRIEHLLERQQKISDAQKISLFNLGDLRIIARLLPRLVVVRVWLARYGYAKTQKRIEDRTQSALKQTPTTEAGFQFPVRVGRIVNGLGHRVPFDAACLVRSLAAVWLLRASGLPAEVRIGVNNESGFHAHAWVEVLGVPVTDTRQAIARFSVFDRSSL